MVCAVVLTLLINTIIVHNIITAITSKYINFCTSVGGVSQNKGNYAATPLSATLGLPTADSDMVYKEQYPKPILVKSTEMEREEYSGEGNADLN